MELKRYGKSSFSETPRKRAAAERKQRREREAYPLLAEHIAAEQPTVSEVMERRAMKNNRDARRQWGSEVYRKIPKSVFATVAWHIANAASGYADADGAAEGRFFEELAALIACGLIDEKQGLAAVQTLERARKGNK